MVDLFPSGLYLDRYSCCIGHVLTYDLHPQKKSGENHIILHIGSRTTQFHKYFKCFPIRHSGRVDGYCHVMSYF